ncbi:MAG: glycosyltransferase family 9 protein [Verrucomicrobiota bacterium]
MKPVILSRPDRVGDVIVTSACIPLVRELHPGAPLILIARSIMESVFAGEGSVDGFIPYDGKDDRDGLKRQLSKLAPDVIYHFHPDEVIPLVAAEVGIPQRVGFAEDKESAGLTDAFPYLKYEGTMHEAEYCRQLLCDASGKSVSNIQQACIAPDPAARERLKQKAPWLDDDEVRISINPTTARLILRWPPEKFEALMHALAREGRRIILVGHPDDDPALLHLRAKGSEMSGTWSDLSGQLDLAESAWLFESCRLHISRDTGTSHLAAAMGCPTLAIFGRLEPEYGPVRWRPLGKSVHLIQAETTKRWWETRRQFWKRSFRSIDADRVIGRARQILD